MTARRRQRYLAVVGWKLVQQLLDSVSLPGTVHVRHPVLRQAAEILINLHRERRRTRHIVKLFSVCTNLSSWMIYIRINPPSPPPALQRLRPLVVTCSGLSPGGTQAYSSEAQPESSSEMECLWKSDTSLVIIFSSWPGTECTACSSRTHLQCTQIFLRRRRRR